MVRVDSDLMKQAILNLVLNGVQSMTAGGALTLKARRDDEMILAEVQDQGCGIPPKPRRKFSNSTSPPRATKVEVESGWRKPTRSCNGTMARSSSIPSSEPARRFACACQRWS